MEGDNEAMRSAFAEYAGYCSHLLVLHNSYIVNKEGIKEDWIVEAGNKLSRMIGEGEIREGSEFQGERTEIAEVKRRMLGTEDAPFADEVNDEETKFFY